MPKRDTYRPWTDAEDALLLERCEAGETVSQIRERYFPYRTHAALDDSGLAHLFTEQQQEALCDAMATARMREKFG